ncbi:putative bifunctional diguanylate cyclase/phosphodiesterase [Oceanisphaera sp. KMM 10153]|uniref:putative bifunctional diguanylate cyclase/phosphodiesterase n=1 Tax=Oceanisphaera submarina TaxID=3390193 RepID=UPI0039770C55
MDNSNVLWTTPADCHLGGPERLGELAERSLILARQIMHHTREGIVLMDARGRVLEVNPAFSRLSELDAADIEGRHLTQINEALHGRRYYRDIWLRLQQQGSWQGEVQHHNREGQLVTHQLMLHLVRGRDGRVNHIIGILDDISRLRRSEDKLSYLAHHDILTGTANRTFLLSWFDKIKPALQQREQLSLLFIDLDRFKPINDSFGHGVGDQLLKALAARLQEQVGPNELVARIGGDEFVMIWRGAMTESALMYKAGKLLERIEAPMQVVGHELSVGASIGVSLYPEHGVELETLLRYADTAMYEAKTYKKTRVCLFDRTRFAHLELQQWLAGDLPQAIKSGHLYLEFQPSLVLDTARWNSLEALLRWRHPELGVLYPAQFLPAVGAAGLWSRLADWVFGEVVRQIRCWQQAHDWQGKVSINLSGLELEQQRAEHWLALLSRQGVSPKRVILEIRSDFIMRRSESLLGVLNRFRAAGMGVYLDNVGEGRFNFGKLRQLPIDGIKLDRSLMSEHFDALDQSVIRSLLLLGKSLGIAVVACGVETDEQMCFLHQHDCGAAQGRLLAFPMSPNEVNAIYSPRKN